MVPETEVLTYQMRAVFSVVFSSGKDGVVIQEARECHLNCDVLDLKLFMIHLTSVMWIIRILNNLLKQASIVFMVFELHELKTKQQGTS